MTLDEMYKYIDDSLSKEGLVLSGFGKEEVAKRWSKKENQGGFSNYWKDTSLEEVLKNKS